MKILIFQENTVECQKQLSFYSTITIIKGHDHQLFDHLKKYTSNLTILSSQLLRQINKIMGIQIFPVKYFRGNSINGSGLATLNLSFTGVVHSCHLITETDRVYPICGERKDQMPIFVFCNKIQIATLCNAVKKVTSKTTHLKAMSHLKEPELVAKIQNYFGVITSTEPPSTDNSTRSAEVKQNYVITNKFWYYLFIFGTALGDEAFYSCFIPFWFWNIDGAVGRRVVLIWTIVMYIGQAVKDILRWPRPGPPVVRLQSKWSLEYGMPSTHAMVAVAFPFSFLLCTVNRYQYNIPLGLVIAVLWCSVICLSRLYLGMHSVLDVIVGLALAVLIMTPLVPIVDYLDNYLLTDSTSPFLLLVVSILMIVYYPNSGKWTPTRGDTAMILSVCVGIHVGAWLNYQLGIMTSSELTPPYAIMWPSYTMLGCTVLRTVIGFALVLLTKAVSKSASYSFFCALLKEDADVLKKSVNSLSNKHKTIVELGCKYVTCAMIGFNALYLIPQLFRYLKIERHTFFTEI